MQVENSMGVPYPVLVVFRVMASISWGLALFEYFFQVPANKIGFRENGGPFTLMQLKVIQKVITLVIFIIFSLLFFKNETFRWNHAIGLVFLVLAVYFIFRK